MASVHGRGGVDACGFRRDAPRAICDGDAPDDTAGVDEAAWPPARRGETATGFFGEELLRRVRSIGARRRGRRGARGSLAALSLLPLSGPLSRPARFLWASEPPSASLCPH